MTDIVDPATRSRMMSGIRGKDTKPEMLIRKALHKRGFRYRLHAKDLPGKPDLVFPKYKAVVFIHGCFWHGHEGCKYFKVPQTRTEFWLNKIEGNRLRDKQVRTQLEESGWRVGIIWECSVRYRRSDIINVLIDCLSDWILSGRCFMEVPTSTTS
ncbi:MAG TPA: very short patch repair endonuclease [Candidatus Thiothrix moscowensis]|uniref:very short patch repair endonuclease n=1 Tax=unclassified Thiothrix TaxID=2636184 RepID=UPI0025FA67A3|nr:MULTISPECIES: very short patch repair endonuclease [unclassified Thiothrix]HRJ51905.1 very short patch repair endonuclease [Candidatus Thiothrix moscowensis]HRJ92220.1 very short patch repair endonuclease [Candidatus Thiothrix moscowensis]